MAGLPPRGSLPGVSSVLVVCAHPDDESFGLGAIIGRFVAGGADVTTLCFTRGEASSLGATARQLAEIRANELAEAAEVLGIKGVKLLDRPDGSLSGESLGDLAAEVTAMAREIGADLLLTFDLGGVTGHPDHHRATEAALAAVGDLPVLAWSLPSNVASSLNEEFATHFVGREGKDLDVVIEVDRSGQRRAIGCHASQSTENPVLWRRLDLLGETESLRWLRRPLPRRRDVQDGADLSSMSHADHAHGIGEEWDRRYASAPRVFRPEPNERLVELVDPIAPGKAVDLGAGEGRNSLWLARRGWEVVAVDASRVALDRLAEAAAGEGLSIQTVVGDLFSYAEEVRAAGAGFDLVVVAYLHPDRPVRAKLLAASASCLGPGGHLFVVGHHLASLGVVGPPYPERLYTEADLQSVPGVEVLALERLEGSSDVEEPGTDVVLWARRETRVTPAS